MKPQRNQPCPCGSGKKFKRCCGNAAALSAAYQMEMFRQKESFRQYVEEQASQANSAPNEFAIRPPRFRCKSALPLAAIMAMTMGMSGGRR